MTHKSETSTRRMPAFSRQLLRSASRPVAGRAGGVKTSVLVLTAALAVGVVIGRTSAKFLPAVSPETVRGVTELAEAGPWGNLGFLPITIAAPAELLAVRGNEETPVRWFFKGYTRDGLGAFLDYLGVPRPQRDHLLTAGQLVVRADGVELIPAREAVLALETKTRRAIYQVLAGTSENDPLREVFLASDIDAIFQNSGVSRQAVSLLMKLSVGHGKYLVCYCLPYVLSGLSSYEEKSNFLQAISRQRTLLAKLRVTPKSDINRLADYWGRACWSTDIKALLGSLAQVPGGGQLDIIELLPPLPSSLLYTFPSPQNPMNGTPVRRDCQWTSFNFFRDPPDARFNDPAFIAQTLKTDYYPVRSDPRFGDLLLFFTPAGDLIHSAVYLADDVVFTKNGNNATRPWILSTIADLRDVYSFHVPPGQGLTAQFYRNKYY